MSYFETISDMPAFEARRTAEANSKDINKWKEIPTADEWSTAELYAARLLVRKDAESTHMLPALQNESDKAKEARKQEQIQKLLKGPDEPWNRTLTRTELLHLYGENLWHMWLLLAHFRNNAAAAACPSAGCQPELATSDITSSFIRHVAVSCPPQHDTRHFKPEHLVELQGLLRKLAGSTGAGAQIRATADAGLVSYALGDNGYYKHNNTRCPALVEARKQFDDFKDGLPVLTDSLLGQLTCEALALRLGLAQAGGREGQGLDENAFVIVSARQYMRFLQFKISDAYVAELLAEEGERDMTEFVELWATPWFDLKSETGRGNAVDNIVGLIVRQPEDINEMLSLV